jgi:hypothetical protein
MEKLVFFSACRIFLQLEFFFMCVRVLFFSVQTTSNVDFASIKFKCEARWMFEQRAVEWMS